MVGEQSQSSEDFDEQLEEAAAFRENVSSFTCQICIEPVSSNMRFNNTNSRCSHHSYCLECIEKYIQAKIEEYNFSEFKCPGLECKEYLDPLICRSFLSEKVFVKWCDVLCESTLSQYQKAYCPFQSCSTLILNECGGMVGKTKCHNCKNDFCFECMTPWHVGSTCGQTRMTDCALLYQLMEQRKWKRCPKCNHGVELKSGCKIIRCRCGTFFCYACGKCNCSCMILHRSHHRFCELLTFGNMVGEQSQSSDDFDEQLEEAAAFRENVSSFTCQLCIEPVSSNMRFNNTNSRCSHHSYCLECIENYIQAKTEEYSLSEIKCPSLDCTCCSFLSEKVFARWCDILCESTLSQCQKAYCPFQNCSALILNECGGMVEKTKCQNCKNDFCFECMTPWHVCFTCAQTRMTDDALLYQLMEQKKWCGIGKWV